MDLDDRVRDALPVNQPYDGLVAEAYDVWLPPDGNYSDRDLFADLVRKGGGPALELGCGNGRLLIGYLADGLDVEGVDSAADMLDICRAHADAAGLKVTLHHADWTNLDLGREYATIYNPAGSFSLIDDEDAARRALVAWLGHLRPGGRLVLGMGVPHPEAASDWEWRLRRSATRADGVTFMVHQAVGLDSPTRVADSIDRHEVWDPDGSLRTTYLRRHRLRFRTPAEITDALRDCGYADVKTAGTDDAFLAFGSRAPYDAMEPDRLLQRMIDRRSVLGAFGVLALAACSGGSKESSTTSASSQPSSSTTGSGAVATTDCVLTPEETEGPFGLDLSDDPALFRRDITEGRAGVPLAVTFVVLDVGAASAPIADARIDVWQTDKDGVYSGFEQPGEDTEGETFIRGIQRTDAAGNATFDTVYPGWYEGRATHIHYQVFLGDGLVATSQLAFPDDATNTVYDSELYRDRGRNDSVPRTADDGIFSDGTAGELLAVTGSVAAGYRGTMKVGIRTA